jgi:hypothetical protein
MCPACLSTIVWAVAGASSAGGVTAWAAKRIRGTAQAQGSTQNVRAAAPTTKEKR